MEMGGNGDFQEVKLEMKVNSLSPISDSMTIMGYFSYFLAFVVTNFDFSLVKE